MTKSIIEDVKRITVSKNKESSRDYRIFQELIDSNLKLSSAPLTEDTVMKNILLPCTFKESSLHVEEVVTELSSTSAESRLITESCDCNARRQWDLNFGRFSY
ncbi:hypothetical protein CEXT_470221 [Caerostris extrusa]|uniref:Uncharacterized protein n=1 Tax=Caerostris extrusa TaxID=172846 RepID=A0AAV4QJU7_CAEEX|nr:hypothetical protein CEXT_470221 [Caerostris extrusa]